MLQATLSSFTAVLATGLPLLEEKTPNAAPESAVERASPALFSWGDADGDTRLDLAAVSAEGVLQLLANAGEGRFEDVTERVGLSGVANAALALWIDYDADGRLDLFVGARAGASRLFHNEGGDFVDMTAGSGLASEGAVQSAHWLDHDGDGRLDLHVATAERNDLFRGLEGGFFERSELPALVGAGVATGGPIVDGEIPSIPSGAPRNDDARGGASIEGSLGIAPRSSHAPIVVGSGSGTASTPPSGLIPSCIPAIRDQANPGACLQASSTPTLGRLYPISANLFVAVGGSVGIGTTTPAARLDVAGTARMSGFELPTGAAAGRVLTSDGSGVGTWQSQSVVDQWVDETGDSMTGTLTLNPGIDQALDVSTGSIFKGGALFIHTKGGARNSGFGREALSSVTTGFENTACGYRALLSHTNGFGNTALGFLALTSVTSGSVNTAVGSRALQVNTGQRNTASGYEALRFNTSGNDNTATGYESLRMNSTGSSNTGIGNNALRNNSTGLRNIGLGFDAGRNLTTGDDNIAIGNSAVAGEGATLRIGSVQTRAFIAGIRGVTTGNANAIPVLIDSAGQLGTVSSSRRFKEEIEDMEDRTERLLQLRPVVFRYKPEVQSGERPLEYGLIAEEVAEVFPELVVHDEDGQPFTVKYHLLGAMLLNELKELDERLDAREEDHARELEELRDRLAALEARVPAAAAAPR